MPNEQNSSILHLQTEAMRKKARLRYKVLHFVSYWLGSYTVTTLVLMGIAFLLNTFSGYYPLPRFWLVLLLSFILAVFLYIPFGKKEKSTPDSEKSEDSKIKTEIIKTLNVFTLKTIEILKKCGIRDDIYKRIVVNLIIAGAAEQLAKRCSLSEEEYHRILHCAIKTAAENIPAFNTEQSRDFYKVLNGKSLENEHRRLIEFGSIAMNRLLTHANEGVFAGIDVLVPLWRKEVIPQLTSLEQDREKNNNVLVLLFTDIVNSTQMARIRGEEISQFVVHTHNAFAREAISRYGGREIKTLGDGMFACFPRPADALNAAILMQKRIARFNIEKPECLFFVRMGLNIGETIAESGDLFGLPVQIAARVCARAGGGSIFISNALYNELKNNEGFTFKEEGDFLFKGLNEKEKVYSVVYDKDDNN